MRLLDRKNLLPLCILVGIGLLFFFFRFYNLDKRIGFGWDQERDATLIREIVVNHKLTLIGPRVVSDTGFYVGPYFTYLLLPFYILSNLHPKGMIYFVFSINVLFFASTYWILKRLFNIKTTLFFLFIWSFNHYLIWYDTISWNPVLIPLGVLTAWFILYRIYKKNHLFDWILLGVISGFFINMHFQFIFIYLFIGIFITYLYFIKKDIKAFHLIAAIGSFLLMFTPLLLFDIRHDFLNTRLFFNFLTSGFENSLPSRVEWFNVFQNFVEPFIYFKSLTLLFYFAFLGMMLYLFKQKKEYFKIYYFASLVLWIIFPVAFFIYNRRPSEYYFNFLYPFIIVTLVDFFITTKKSKILMMISLILFIFNISHVLSLINRVDPLGFFYLDKTAVKIKQLTDGEKFNVTYDVSPGRNSGFGYLLNWYNVRQSGDFTDPLVEIRIPPKEGDIKVGTDIGIKIPEELKK